MLRLIHDISQYCHGCGAFHEQAFLGIEINHFLKTSFLLQLTSIRTPVLAPEPLQPLLQLKAMDLVVVTLEEEEDLDLTESMEVEDVAPIVAHHIQSLTMMIQAMIFLLSK